MDWTGNSYLTILQQLVLIVAILALATYYADLSALQVRAVPYCLVNTVLSLEGY